MSRVNIKQETFTKIRRKYLHYRKFQLSPPYRGQVDQLLW